MSRIMDWCDAMVAELQADLGIDPMAGFWGTGDDLGIPFQVVFHG